MHARGSAAAAAAARLLALAALAGCSAAPGPADRRSAPVPVLGQLAGVFAGGSGFGQVRPAMIFNGGDPTGLVTHIVWRSWGQPRAVGTGFSDYPAPGQPVTSGTQQRVTVVAFSLGTCAGRRMYRAVEWYFPQHGQAFDPGRYEDICAGTYVPAG
ncbi:MAG TPA: hypothetical protein VH637_10115 [Streptosporangiaceae bacterium]|jgi:hypothetical protein